MVAPAPTAATAMATLTVDLGALAANWQILNDRFTGTETAAVVKADGYGLGTDHVGPALWDAGCRTFFVATIDEGIALRAHLKDAAIHVLGGLLPGSEAAFVEHALVPVLNDLGQVDAWKRFCLETDFAHACDLHIDSGMLRLGLPPYEANKLAADPARIEGLDLRFLLSHLASADDTESPQNMAQLTALRGMLDKLPARPVSFANSSGIFLGSDFHFDLARPGVALYGVNPTPGRANPMRPVVTLTAKILQIRDVDAPETVGYGASHRIDRPGRIATIGVGYADGYLRSLSNRGHAIIGTTKVAVVGRVSMDLITLDVTEVPEAALYTGAPVQLIGPGYDLDDIARDADTIGYEILTGLGKRYHRDYVNAETGA